jgi:hypothetical protein
MAVHYTAIWLIGQLFVKKRRKSGLRKDELIQHYSVLLPRERRRVLLSFIRRVNLQDPANLHLWNGVSPLIHVLAWRFAQGIQFSETA